MCEKTLRSLWNPYEALIHSLQHLRSNTYVGFVVKLAIYAVECLFAIGIMGSAIVVILTAIEDSEVFFAQNDELPLTGSSVQPEDANGFGNA